MDIKDGIIINGEFHKKETVNNIACSQCSLKSYCDIVDNNYDVWMCTIHNCLGFIRQGTVTELKVEEKRNEKSSIKCRTDAKTSKVRYRYK